MSKLSPEFHPIRFRDRHLYRPVKRQLTLRLDSDIIHWFKTHTDGGRGYQTRINAALRKVVEEEMRGGEVTGGGEFRKGATDVSTIDL